tara:strand:+ start:376 stop:609 length:234 start_codon:yes stop_codon:yes gene_type:complete
MKDLNYNTIYSNLKQAQYICAEYPQLNNLFDLITHNLNLLDDYDDFIKLEKENISNFSIYAFKTAVAYKEALKYSLI